MIQHLQTAVPGGYRLVLREQVAVLLRTLQSFIGGLFEKAHEDNMSCVEPAHHDQKKEAD